MFFFSVFVAAVCTAFWDVFFVISAFCCESLLHFSRFFVRKSIQQVFHRFVNEQESPNGISELLEILGRYPFWLLKLPITVPRIYSLLSPWGHFSLSCSCFRSFMGLLLCTRASICASQSQRTFCFNACVCSVDRQWCADYVCVIVWLRKYSCKKPLARYTYTDIDTSWVFAWFANMCLRRQCACACLGQGMLLCVYGAPSSVAQFTVPLVPPFIQAACTYFISELSLRCLFQRH